MAILTVRHRTVYRYAEPVRLGDHYVMFRPREGHDLRLIRSHLEILPRPAGQRWLHDVFDNSVAVVSFEGMVSELSFESLATLEQFESTTLEYSLEDYARYFPFFYSDDDFPNLSRALFRELPSQAVDQWVRQFLNPDGQTQTISLLRAITAGIRTQFAYTQRHEKGVQTPDETLRSGRGSCRDFAVLMMDGLRSLGLAARFVSGYIFSAGGPSGGTVGTQGGGSTHAWMQAYLPGAGWIDFDPTNSIVGNRNLIRVAVAWSPDQVLPLWGTYVGSPGSFLGMDVAVSVTRDEGTES